MKKIILTLAVLASLASCTTQRLVSVSDERRGEISWSAFCQATGHDLDDHTYATVIEYFDTWCGSVEEEKAFIEAGVQPE